MEARLKAEIELLKQQLKQTKDENKKQGDVIINLKKKIEELKHEHKKTRRKKDVNK